MHAKHFEQPKNIGGIMDQQAVAALVNPDGDFAYLREVLTIARQEAASYLGVDPSIESIPNGCATVLSIMIWRGYWKAGLAMAAAGTGWRSDTISPATSG